MPKDPYDVRQIFDDMTMDLIGSMKRNLKRHQNDELGEGFRWEQWQAGKLRALADYQKTNRRLITSAVKQAEELTGAIVKQSHDQGGKREATRWNRMLNFFLKPFGLSRQTITGKLSIPENIKPLLPSIVKKYLDMPPPTQEDSFFKLNTRKLDALQDGIIRDLRSTQGAIYRKMDDVYRQVVYRTSHYVSAGAKTIDQATDMATKEFLSRGIDCVTYSDGRKVNVAAYVEMALRTVSQRATFLGEGEFRDEIGIHTVVMSAHGNCSPMCLPYQGKVFIDDVYTSLSKEQAIKESEQTGYMRLSQVMSKGAFHNNCRHTLATFFPGVSNLPDIPDADTAERNYEAEQKQRYMERQIRQYKRLETGSLDDSNQAKYGVKVKEWQGKLNEHLVGNDHLRRDKKREQDLLPTSGSISNGLSDKYLTIPETTKAHASKGDFTNPKNPKKHTIGSFKSGGHGQENINFLKQNNIEYNIVHEYKNGVRIGNVPDHKDKLKRTGTKQSWFPKEWTADDIAKAGQSVANNRDSSKYILKSNLVDGQKISIYKYAEYKGVTVGICYDVKKGKITTIFPDETQRLGGA